MPKIKKGDACYLLKWKLSRMICGKSKPRSSVYIACYLLYHKVGLIWVRAGQTGVGKKLVNMSLHLLHFLFLDMSMCHLFKKVLTVSNKGVGVVFQAAWGERNARI